MRIARTISLVVLVVAWSAAPTPAQWLITPYVGVNIAGDVEHGKGGPGGAVGYLGDRLGLEVDFQRYQHFFKDSEVFPLNPAAPPNCTPGVAGPCSDINTDAMGFMGNVVVPIRVHRAPKWRPYGTAGLGMIRAWAAVNDPGTFVTPAGETVAGSPSSAAESDRDQNDFGFNGGGGVMYSLNSRAGLRGELRYFRALVNENKREAVYFKNYGFWRAAIGVTVGFPAN
jgi:opacity protein-like surface antigen